MFTWFAGVAHRDPLSREPPQLLPLADSIAPPTMPLLLRLCCYLPSVCVRPLCALAAACHVSRTADEVGGCSPCLLDCERRLRTAAATATVAAAHNR